MTTQTQLRSNTEAERLADGNEKCAKAWVEGSDAYKFRMDTAAELRRLVSFSNQLMDEVARLQKREWVGLTDEERNEIAKYWSNSIFVETGQRFIQDYGIALEAKLKEKNHE